jgi:hypothetical protein
VPTKRDDTYALDLRKSDISAIQKVAAD